jgi:hypothetical protein
MHSNPLPNNNWYAVVDWRRNHSEREETKRTET